MSRDMKPRKRGNGARRKSGGGTLLGLFVGLVIGVLAAAAVVWYIHRTPPPFTAKTPPPAPSAAQQQPQATQTPQAAPAPQAPLALPGKPGDPVPQASDKPRFDFYKILPGNTDAVPDGKETKPGSDKSRNEKEGMLAEPLYLQAGSFQKAGDADNQKARLAMMGAEAAIQQVMIQDKVWYRVRLGPFRKMDEVNQLRAELAKQGIEANVVKKD